MKFKQFPVFLNVLVENKTNEKKIIETLNPVSYFYGPNCGYHHDKQEKMKYVRTKK